MSRLRVTGVLTIVLFAAGAYPAGADVRANEKTHVEFAGMLGRMFNLFGGRAAREGVTSTVAVRGDRKATLTGTTGQIVDLGEEKVYDLDMRKKTYRVTTFAELRQRMEDARKKAEEDARKESAEQKSEPPPPDESRKQVDVDFDVKNTGQTRTINGYDTHESVMTVTVREKGKTLDESGGLVLTADMWLAPKIAAMKEITDFDVRYAKKLYGGMLAGVSAEQMAAAVALYPMMKQAMGKMASEGQKLEGTAVQTTTTMDAVKSAEQMKAEVKAKEGEKKSVASGGVGGMLGGFAKKMAQKKAGGDADAKPRATFMTATTDILKVSTDPTAADVAIPAGFELKK